jgi:hypothetical protein
MRGPKRRRRGPLAPLRAAALVACAVGVLGALSARASASEPASPSTTEAGAALAGLRSPFLLERREAVERLVALGPSARDEVLSAFRAADAPLRALLVEVMAADGSVQALTALLDALPTTDPETAAAIRNALVSHAETAGPALDERVKATPVVPKRLLDLDRLLLRARIEAAFLSRKSLSGGTGYYRGQFDVLLPPKAPESWREAALPILFAILADRPLKVPGEHPVGGYEFLRAPSFLLEPGDARVMAGNALGELLRPTDRQTLRTLGHLYREYWEVAQRSQDDERNVPMEALLLDTILPALYRVDPERWSEDLAALLEYMDRRSSWSAESRATLLLRVGRYGEAVEAYLDVIRYDMTKAIPFYNLACTFATWSLDVPPKEAAKHRTVALRHLRRSFEHGYLDWPWMEQDRDLDPIRDTPEYRALLAEMKAQFVLPPLPGSGAPPPSKPGR